MSALMVVMAVLVAVLGLAVVALSFRLWKLRRGGTAAIMRDIPAVGGQGWRHGVIRLSRRRCRILSTVQCSAVAGSSAQQTWG